MLQRGISVEELNGMNSASKIGLNQIVKGFFFQILIIMIIL